MSVIDCHSSAMKYQCCFSCGLGFVVVVFLASVFIMWLTWYFKGVLCEWLPMMRVPKSS
jgi:hypothetical protein